MPRQTTYAKAQANLADLCDQVTADREVVVISRRGADDVALVAASELSGLDGSLAPIAQKRAAFDDRDEACSITSDRHLCSGLGRTLIGSLWERHSRA